jgi:hypothetical protein
MRVLILSQCVIVAHAQPFANQKTGAGIGSFESWGVKGLCGFMQAPAGLCCSFSIFRAVTACSAQARGLHIQLVAVDMHGLVLTQMAGQMRRRKSDCPLSEN